MHPHPIHYFSNHTRLFPYFDVAHAISATWDHRRFWGVNVGMNSKTSFYMLGWVFYRLGQSSLLHLNKLASEVFSFGIFKYSGLYLAEYLIMNHCDPGATLLLLQFLVSEPSTGDMMINDQVKRTSAATNFFLHHFSDALPLWVTCPRPAFWTRPIKWSIASQRNMYVHKLQTRVVGILFTVPLSYQWSQSK